MPAVGSCGSPGSVGASGRASAGMRTSPGPRSSTTTSSKTPVACASVSIALIVPSRLLPIAASAPSTSVRMPTRPTICPRKNRYDFAANASEYRTCSTTSTPRSRMMRSR